MHTDMYRFYTFKAHIFFIWYTFSLKFLQLSKAEREILSHNFGWITLRREITFISSLFEKASLVRNHDNSPFTFTQPETKFKLQQLNLMTYLFFLWVFPRGLPDCWCLVWRDNKYVCYWYIKWRKQWGFWLTLDRVRVSVLSWCGVWYGKAQMCLGVNKN